MPASTKLNGWTLCRH